MLSVGYVRRVGCRVTERCRVRERRRVRATKSVEIKILKGEASSEFRVQVE